MNEKLRGILPGIGVSLAVAIVAQLLAQVIPSLGGATIAILLGIVVGNLWLHQPQLGKGTKYAESKFLEVSVMLLGLTVTFQTIEKIGWVGAIYIIVQMTVTILWAVWFGRRLKFKREATQLMAGGNAVCGSSAIAAIAPVIEADDESVGTTITLVNLMGTFLMLFYPLVATTLVGNSQILQGALIGGTLQSVGQVIASASMISPTVVTYATLFKIMRILMLVPVVLIFGADHEKHSEQTNHSKKRVRVPWYVLGFLIFCVINSLIHINPVVGNSAHWLSSWLEIIALAAIGLRLNLRAFLAEGKQLMFYGIGVLAVQIVSATGLIHLFL